MRIEEKTENNVSFHHVYFNIRAHFEEDLHGIMKTDGKRKKEERK